jgi:hypothetical protein
VCGCVCARGFFFPLKFETGSKCEREIWFGERARFGRCWLH